MCLYYFQLKAKKEKAHATQQRAQSQKQLEEARRANIDKLVGNWVHVSTLMDRVKLYYFPKWDPAVHLLIFPYWDGVISGNVDTGHAK